MELQKTHSVVTSVLPVRNAFKTKAYVAERGEDKRTAIQEQQHDHKTVRSKNSTSGSLQQAACISFGPITEW